MKLLLESIKQKTKKDGSTIEGVSKKGVHWSLWRINNKYDYFHYGEEEPDFDIGIEYEFDLKTEQQGEYTNSILSLPTTKSKEQDKTINGLKEIYKLCVVIDGKLNALKDFFIKNGDSQDKNL